mgnify:CR=1 FL=1
MQFFKCGHKKKSQGVKSQDLDGHIVWVLKLMTRSPKKSLRNAIFSFYSEHTSLILLKKPSSSRSSSCNMFTKGAKMTAFKVLKFSKLYWRTVHWKNMGPIILLWETAAQTAIFCEWDGISVKKCGFSVVHIFIFWEFTYPETWKQDSSVNITFSSAYQWISDKIAVFEVCLLLIFHVLLANGMDTSVDHF